MLKLLPLPSAFILANCLLSTPSFAQVQNACGPYASAGANPATNYQISTCTANAYVGVQTDAPGSSSLNLYNGTPSSPGGSISGANLYQAINITGNNFRVGDVINYGTLSSGQTNNFASSGIFVNGTNPSVDAIINTGGGVISSANTNIGAGILPAAIEIITSAGGVATGTIGLILNQGIVSGSSAASGINNQSNITTLTNTGTISTAGTAANGYFGYKGYSSGLDGYGNVGTLNNAQGRGNAAGPLTYSGNLPSNYNIIVNSTLSYGQLNVFSTSLAPYGTMSFGIFGGATYNGNNGDSFTVLPSVLGVGTYTNVLQGLSGNLSGSTIAGTSGVWTITNTTGNYNNANGAPFSYSLTAGGTAGAWDLVVLSAATNISGVGTIYQSSNVGISVNPVFDGGTLQVSASGSVSSNFSVSSTNGVIDQNGRTSTFSGIISDAVTGTAGSIAITNSASNGSVSFSNANTYTGSTTINSGATLALSGTGSIATSSGVANSGTFDISNTTNGASVKAISGTGAVILGTQNLTVSNASGNLSGAVTGSGAINITGGNQTLSGNNSTFTGGVQVQSGAALTIPAVSALGSGTLALVGSSSVPATLNVTGNTTIANNITVAGDPVFNVATGTTTTVSSPITNGSVAGDVVVAGGGTLNLTAANTYTGLTAIGAGSTLALSGNGSITPSVSVTNNGTFNVSGKTGNVALGGSFTQTSAGGLVMGFAPTSNQRVTVAGAAALAGSLSLVASGGTYSAGRYTLLTANGVTGTFGTFSSNLNTYTNLAYSLSYDANDVYLNMFTSGPSTVDTQQSLANTVQAVQSTFTILNTALANSFSYDCNEFGANGICISAGGRNTAVSAANGLNNTSALLIAAYRPHPNYRIGAYADQNLSMNNAGSTVNLGNNTPLIGLFGAWNERLDGTGTEVKVSAAYGQKNTTVTRQVVGTSQPGSGGAPIDSQGAQVTAKYGFGVADQVIVSPYVGIRYTQNNMGGYTEATSTSVTTPLTYSALNTNATTALAGVGASYRGIPQTTLFASAGVETDTNTANGSYNATGLTGLTPVNFNPNPVKTRPTAMLGASYDVEKNQRLGVTGIYRQEAYQATASTTVMATYTVGF